MYVCVYVERERNVKEREREGGRLLLQRMSAVNCGSKERKRKRKGLGFEFYGLRVKQFEAVGLSNPIFVEYVPFD